MAIEKVLNTRIQLKYDSYTNWTNQNPVLKSGEIAIAYLANSHTTTTPDNNTHAVMFKVGPGNFNSLPWASALAADVYGWAKQSEADFVKNFLAMKDSDGASIQAKLDALFVTPAEMEKALEDLEAALTGADGLAGAVARIDAIEKNMATDAELAAAIAKEVTDRDAAIAAESAQRVAAEQALGKRITDELAAEALARDNADTELLNKINAIDFVDEDELAEALNPYAKTADVMAEIAKYQLAGDYATKAEAQAMADGKNAAIAEAKKAGDDAAAALATYKTANDAAVALKATEADLQAEIARAQAAEKANADAIELLTNGVDQDKVDGVKDLIKYVEDHGPEVTGMKEDIADNAKAISDEAARADAEEKRLAGLIADNAEDIAENARAIAALNAADGKVANAAYADKANSLTEAAKEEVKDVKVNDAAHADVADKASGLDESGVAAVKAVKVDNAAHADDADKLGGVEADKYALKTDAQGYADTAEANAKTAAQGYANTAETNAKDYAKKYADDLAGNYATAAQGAKADSALQEITTTAGEGLKVTNKNHIDIDTDVVFVFNCGSASVLVD